MPADYLPARMVNAFVYCPRLFFYEWVEGVFVDNQETVEGSLRHKKLDGKLDPLPSADELAASGDTIHSRSVMLSSELHRVIAKLDLIEAADGVVTPVDYKRGSPRIGADGQLTAWDPDRIQLCVQAIVLRENGYTCQEGVIYYVMTRQRVRVEIDDDLMRQTLAAIDSAYRLAEEGAIPPPLEDSPKCPRCSLVGVCLPDETLAMSRRPSRPAQRLLFDIGLPASASADPVEEHEVRRLTPARDDLRPLYLNSQGLYVGKSGNVLKLKEKENVVQEVRINEICQLNLFGAVQMSTQTVQTLCENEVPIAYFSMGGWFYGVTQGLGVKNIYLRREQFRLADSAPFCLRFARALVAGKIRNQRTMLQRNHVEPPSRSLALMKCMQQDAEQASTMDELLGIEGNAARIYFENFSGMIKIGRDSLGDIIEDYSEADRPSESAEPELNSPSTSAGDMSPLEVVKAEGNGRQSEGPATAPFFSFDFTTRNRRPPRDPVNALLSLAYSVLAKDLTIVCHMVGFDPFLGFYHQPRYGRASLALDLMEPFRPLIADSAVLSAINTRMVTPSDFVQAGPSCALRPEGRKAFFRAYEQRMDTLATHPLFGYRVNYRRLLEIQTRLLARLLMGELASYPVFTTR